MDRIAIIRKQYIDKSCNGYFIYYIDESNKSQLSKISNIDFSNNAELLAKRISILDIEIKPYNNKLPDISTIDINSIFPAKTEQETITELNYIYNLVKTDLQIQYENSQNCNLMYNKKVYRLPLRGYIFDLFCRQYTVASITNKMQKVLLNSQPLNDDGSLGEFESLQVPLEQLEAKIGDIMTLATENNFIYETSLQTINKMYSNKDIDGLKAYKFIFNAIQTFDI